MCRYQNTTSTRIYLRCIGTHTHTITLFSERRARVFYKYAKQEVNVNTHGYRAGKYNPPIVIRSQNTHTHTCDDL